MFAPPLEEMFIEFLTYRTLDPSLSWHEKRETRTLASRVADRYERWRQGQGLDLSTIENPVEFVRRYEHERLF